MDPSALQPGPPASKVIDLQEKLSTIADLWSPRIVAQLNDYHLKLARVEGEFVWHSHPETDEAFLVVDGTLEIDLPDRTVTLEPGQLFVVPRGIEHRPRAVKPCGILLIEPAGTVNTGDAKSNKGNASGLSSTSGTWI
jgi:mannose-6-phosphate isomerase-like protein (cupin superfamily)